MLLHKLITTKNINSMTNHSLSINTITSINISCRNTNRKQNIKTHQKTSNKRHPFKPIKSTQIIIPPFNIRNSQILKQNNKSPNKTIWQINTSIDHKRSIRIKPRIITKNILFKKTNTIFIQSSYKNARKNNK